MWAECVLINKIRLSWLGPICAISKVLKFIWKTFFVFKISFNSTKASQFRILSRSFDYMSYNFTVTVFFFWRRMFHFRFHIFKIKAAHCCPRVTFRLAASAALRWKERKRRKKKLVDKSWSVTWREGRKGGACARALFATGVSPLRAASSVGAHAHSLSASSS